MSRLRNMLKRFDKSSSRAITVNDGETLEVRLLPPYPREAMSEAKKKGADLDYKTGILVFNMHPWLPMLGKDNRDQQGQLRRTAYRCKKDLKKPCGFCEFFENLSQEDKELRYRHGRSGVGVADVYVKDTGEIKRWFLRKRLIERLNEILELYPDINDENLGRSLYIVRTGSGLKTRWSLKVGKKPWKVELPEELPDIVTEMDNCKVLKDSSIQKVLDLVWGEEAGESYDE